MKELRIGALAKEAGLRPSALRYYEHIGLLPPPRRSGGQRRYHPRDVERLKMIMMARELGFSLAEIKVLLDGLSPASPPSERWRSVAEARLPEIERLIQRARWMKRILERGLNCACITMEDCLAQYSEMERGWQGGDRDQ